MTNIRKDAYIVGRNVTVECEGGYLLVGNATITCSKHGTWKPHLPVCVPISKYLTNNWQSGLGLHQFWYLCLYWTNNSIFDGIAIG